MLLDTGPVELLRRKHRQVETLAIRHYPPVLCRHVAGEFLYGQLLADAAPERSSKLRNILPALSA